MTGRDAASEAPTLAKYYGGVIDQIDLLLKLRDLLRDHLQVGGEP